MSLTSETLAEWPYPPQVPTQALEHALWCFRDVEDEYMAFPVTSGIYQDRNRQSIRTGLTLGDLRNLAIRLDVPFTCPQEMTR